MDWVWVRSKTVLLCTQPWQGYQGENKGFWVCKKKMQTSAEMLCRYTPPEFSQFVEAVMNLKFDEEPRYAAYINLLAPVAQGDRVHQSRSTHHHRVDALPSWLDCPSCVHALPPRDFAGRNNSNGKLLLDISGSMSMFKATLSQPLYDPNAPTKKIRIGWPALQWITVYNKQS